MNDLFERRKEILMQREILNRELKNINQKLRTRRKKKQPQIYYDRYNFKVNHPEITDEIYDEIKIYFPKDKSGRINTREALKDWQIIKFADKKPKNITLGIAYDLLDYYKVYNTYNKENNNE